MNTAVKETPDRPARDVSARKRYSPEVRAVSPDEINHDENTHVWSMNGEPELTAWHDYQTECDVCAAMLMSNPAALERGMARLKGEYFFHPLHFAIFSTIRALYKRQQAGEVLEIEPILVAMQMPEIGDYKKQYCDDYLREMLTRCPSSANIGFYIDVLIGNWRKRQTWYLVDDVKKATARSATPAKEILALMRAGADALESNDPAALEIVFKGLGQ